MKKILFIILLFPSICFGYTADTCILGPGDGSAGSNVGSDNLSSTGQNRDDLWKAFRWKAGGSGDAYVFRMRVCQIDSPSTSHDVAFAVYTDTSGPEPGTMMFSGHVAAYNWNTIGVGIHYFDIDTVHTTRAIVADSYYWLTVRTSTSNDDTLWFDRQSSEDLPTWADDDMKIMSNFPLDNPETYPGWAASWGSYYEDNYYGWSVYTASDAGIQILSTDQSSDTFSHGDPIVINGNEFGAKNPAAPLIWDDCEDKTIDNDAAITNSGWDEVHPPVGSANVVASRLRYRTIPYRSTAAPHDNSDQYMVGNHYQYANNSPQYIGGAGAEEAEGYSNVLVTIDTGVADEDIWFGTWYYKLDTSWPLDNASRCAWNHKMSAVNTGPGSYDTPMSYMNYCNLQAPSFGGDPEFQNDHGMGDCGTICSDPETLTSDNPLDDWIRFEDRWQSDASVGLRDIYINNKLVTVLQSNCPDMLNDTRSYTVGGYFRYVDDDDAWGDCEDSSNVNVMTGSQGAWRYFDDIYVDTTWSRVMLANNATYANATIMEPQIPSVWAAGEITVTVNQGAIPNGTAYLFVFDSDNEANEDGYPVTLEADIIDPIFDPPVIGKSMSGGIRR